jgi:hypothetical protein
MLGEEKAFNFVFKSLEPHPFNAEKSGDFFAEEVLNGMVLFCFFFPSCPANGVIVRIPFETVGFFIPKVLDHTYIMQRFFALSTRECGK